MLTVSHKAGWRGFWYHKRISQQDRKRKNEAVKGTSGNFRKELARFNPEAPLTMLFDYVKIRFPTLDIQHIIKDILKLNVNYMLHEDYGHYSYTEHYSLGDIFIYTSADEEKGVLLELKGRGCRQFESYLLAQQRSWYDFLMDALVDGGVMKRIDLAINDHTGILDIQSLRRNAGNGNISESPEAISFTSRASLSSTERTTEIYGTYPLSWFAEIRCVFLYL